VTNTQIAIFKESYPEDKLTEDDQNHIVEELGRLFHNKKTKQKKTNFVAYRPSDRRLSAKLVPTLADRGCRAVSATDPHGR
jgi:hypothetical protein